MRRFEAVSMLRELERIGDLCDFKYIGANAKITKPNLVLQQLEAFLTFETTWTPSMGPIQNYTKELIDILQ